MKKLAIIVNWVLLAVFGIVLVIMLVRSPGVSAIGSLFLLAPYAITLLALKSAPNRALAGLGMLFNVFIVAFCAFGLFAAFAGRLEEPVRAIIGGFLFLMPSTINCKVLVNQWEVARLGAPRSPQC